MAKVSVQVEVSKEMYELGMGLASIVDAVKTALADGWQPGTDLPMIVMSAINTIPPALQGVDQVKAELAEDKGAFISAVALPIAEVVKKF